MMVVAVIAEKASLVIAGGFNPGMGNILLSGYGFARVDKTVRIQEVRYLHKRLGGKLFSCNYQPDIK